MQIPAPDASVSAPCDWPDKHINGGDWEIIAGRLGEALILCGLNHAALAEYLSEIIGAQ